MYTLFSVDELMTQKNAEALYFPLSPRLVDAFALQSAASVRGGSG